MINTCLRICRDQKPKKKSPGMKSPYRLEICVRLIKQCSEHEINTKCQNLPVCKYTDLVLLQQIHDKFFLRTRSTFSVDGDDEEEEGGGRRREKLSGCGYW